MKTQVHQTVNGPVALVPLVMPDRKRSFRRLRPVLGRRPVALASGNGFAVYAAADSIAAAVHFQRVREVIPVLCSCCSTNPARTGQRTCLDCHATLMRIARLDRKTIHP